MHACDMASTSVKRSPLMWRCSEMKRMKLPGASPPRLARGPARRVRPWDMAWAQCETAIHVLAWESVQEAQTCALIKADAHETANSLMQCAHIADCMRTFPWLCR